ITTRLAGVPSPFSAVIRSAAGVSVRPEPSDTGTVGVRLLKWAHLLTCGDQIKGTQKNGVCHGLESNRRKLETTQGPSQGEVGSAHRRRSRRHQWAARPARGQDSGTLRPCQGPGQKGCRRLVQVTAVSTVLR